MPTAALQGSLPVPLDFAAVSNTILENNLRLPDAITIEHGPRRLLARFIIAADRAAREQGLYLRVRHDFDELMFLNRTESARGNWHPMLDYFNTECVARTRSGCRAKTRPARSS